MFERFPELKIVSAENDIAWVPHLLERADKYYRRFKQGYGTLLSLKPSEYFRRQVFATFIDDPLGLKVYSYLGADNFILVNRLSASGCDLAAHNGSAGARFCSASGGRPAKDVARTARRFMASRSLAERAAERARTRSSRRRSSPRCRS